MEFHQPSKISLPSVRSILDEAPLRTGSSVERPCHLWPNPASTTSSLPYSHSNVAMSMTNNLDTRPDPTTPEQQRNASTGYPTPSSDDPPSDVEMDKGPSWSGAAKRPLFKVDESVLQLGDAESLASDGCTKPNLDLGFTPTIVHYRPNGIPNARSRKALGNSDSQKSRNRIISKDESGEETAKVRMVKWDRVTDKGTAPLNVEARTTGPRSCTLCHITKRRCDRTDGARPNETHPCANCQKGNFVCQFISPSQLREGTTQPPTVESLKVHCDQAQRLRTIELEEKVAKLEHALEMANTENRVQSGYIMNLKVYDSIVKFYIWRLRERLEELEPGCTLLKHTVPLMPQGCEKDRCFEGDGASLCDVIERMPVIDAMDVDLPYRG